MRVNREASFMGQVELRDDFVGVVAHIKDVLAKIVGSSGGGAILTQADVHTLGEGLFLYAWTHWEQFTHFLLVEDLATIATSKLHGEVASFHSPESPFRLANSLLSHPDHPQRFIEWSDYSLIESRANEFLGEGNRFAVAPLPRRSDLDLLKRVRNAIAHRSDKAWSSFLGLCQNPPFSIAATDMANMTPGRFLIDHSWNGQAVLSDVLEMLDAAAKHLVT
ncbi:MAG: hypothetical protein K2Y37_22085 [Pirellulales bacterium]|nr:hypothetical protein [Pirellulales bacterium]